MRAYSMVRILGAGYYRDLFAKNLAREKLNNLSYDKAIEHLKQRGFLYPGSFSGEMKKLGNQCIDVVADSYFLQQLWAKENGQLCVWKAKNDQYTFLINQLRKIQPEVIYFQDFSVLPHSLRQQLKKDILSIRVVTGFQGFPSKSYTDFSDLDGVFISYPAYRGGWEQAGVRTCLLYHCFDPYMAVGRQEQAVAHDFTFVGSSGYGSPYHAGRYSDLVKLLAASPLEVWGYEKNISLSYETVLNIGRAVFSLLPASILATSLRALRRQHRLRKIMEDAYRIKRGELERWPWYLQAKPISQLFPQKTHPAVYGNSYYQLLRQSRIVLNRHTDEPGEGGNIRTFEVTGLNVCLLTDIRPNLTTLFDVDREIVTYKNLDECLSKMNYLLSNESARKQISRRGQERVLKDHTTAIRCATINEAIAAWL